MPKRSYTSTALLTFHELGKLKYSSLGMAYPLETPKKPSAKAYRKKMGTLIDIVRGCGLYTARLFEPHSTGVVRANRLFSPWLNPGNFLMRITEKHLNCLFLWASGDEKREQVSSPHLKRLV